MVSGYLHVLLDVRRCSASFAKLTCFHHISDVWSVWLMKRREVKKKRLLIVNQIQVGEPAFLTRITAEIPKGDLTKIHQRAQSPQEVCTPFHCAHQMNLPLFFTCKCLNKNYHTNHVKQTNNLSKTPFAFSHSVFWRQLFKTPAKNWKKAKLFDIWWNLVKSPSHLGWFRAIIFSHNCQHLYLFCHPYILLIWWKIFAFLPTSWSGVRPEQVTRLPFFLVRSGRSLWQVDPQTNLKVVDKPVIQIHICAWTNE